MRFKVHPHKPMVDAGVEACVSITPIKKHGRAYYMGSVMMKDVAFTVHHSGLMRMRTNGQRNVHAWMTGNILMESVEQYRPEALDKPLMTAVRYDLWAGRFIAEDGTDVTDGMFNAGVIVGKECFISKEW